MSKPKSSSNRHHTEDDVRILVVNVKKRKDCGCLTSKHDHVHHHSKERKIKKSPSSSKSAHLPAKKSKIIEDSKPQTPKPKQTENYVAPKVVPQAYAAPIRAGDFHNTTNQNQTSQFSVDFKDAQSGREPGSDFSGTARLSKISVASPKSFESDLVPTTHASTSNEFDEEVLVKSSTTEVQATAKSKSKSKSGGCFSFLFGGGKAAPPPSKPPPPGARKPKPAQPPPAHPSKKLEPKKPVAPAKPPPQRQKIKPQTGPKTYTYKTKNFGSTLSFVPNRIYNFGEKGSGFTTKGEPQDFYKLRDDCLQNGRLYEDPEFLPNDSALFFSQKPDRRFEWKRPGEITRNPQLFVEGFSRFDVQQGELGDCWLLAAVANLTLYRRLFFQIVPDDQDFDENYAGIFHFRFWQYGRWIDVVIDDRLPTYRGQLVFLHSTEENEFWSALLEKAYAKLHGSYEALKGGSTCEAMEDFTGGVTEMYEMNAVPPNLFKIISKAYERASLMGCSIEPDPNVVEAQTPEGLIRGHAYSITRVKYVDISTPNVAGKIPLLRLRNPWGNESEWNGPWSDNSPEWRYISDSEKQDLGLTFDDDGEFWMSFKDFQHYFSRLEICNLNPDSLSDQELTEGRNKKWEMSVFEGEWVRGVTAGGCRNFLETFWHNPQYRVTLTEVDEGDDEGKCTMIVGLMQKNRRQIRNTGADLLTVGFAIYHLPYPDRVSKPLDLNFFKYNASVARSPSFINLREVSCRFKLPPGTYAIVPSTFDPNEEGEFLLRVFSENKNNMEENEKEVGFGEIDKRVVPTKPSPEDQKDQDKLLELFKKLAGDDGEVDWMELKQILDHYTKKETKGKGFSKDICRSMIAMLDEDKSGKLGYKEFVTLWNNIKTWKNIFNMYDKDNSGTFTGFELREALQSAGYNLNSHILNIIMHRYGNRKGEIDFDDFIMCAIKLKTMLDIFKAKTSGSKNTASFVMEEWVEYVLYS